MYRPSSIFVLPVLTFAEFAGTSIWFAPNAVVSQIPNFGSAEIASLTSLVQIGFIIGTFILTYFATADRYEGPVVFMTMGLVGALFNVLCITSTNFALWAVLRTLVGICLAGVYPIGMKIAAKQYPDGLGPRLGLLIAALTMGTAFPWLLRGLTQSQSTEAMLNTTLVTNTTPNGSGELPFEGTIAFVSGIATIGALVIPVMMLEPGTRISSLLNFITCGSHSRKASQGDESESGPTLVIGREAVARIWSNRDFRAAAIGYWGHMWELYAFWAFVPVLIESHQGPPVLNSGLTTFLTIAIGALSSGLAGLWSINAGRGILPGSAVAALVSLIVSMVCCLIAPVYQSLSPGVFLFFVLVWGFAVIADSGQYSTLCANFANKELVGTALTLTTCVGFGITIISIQVLGAILKSGVDPGLAFLVLFPGPLVGVCVSYYQWPLHLLLTTTKQHNNSLTDDEAARHEDSSVDGNVKEDVGVV